MLTIDFSATNNIFMINKRNFNPKGLECLMHLKFSQKHCNLVTNMSMPPKATVLAHVQKHNLSDILRRVLLAIKFVIFVSEIPITSKWKSSSSNLNNNSTFSKLRLMLTILLWKMEKLDPIVFSGNFCLNILKLCGERYRLCMRWCREVKIGIQIGIQIRV